MSREININERIPASTPNSFWACWRIRGYWTSCNSNASYRASWTGRMCGYVYRHVCMWTCVGMTQVVASTVDIDTAYLICLCICDALTHAYADWRTYSVTYTHVFVDSLGRLFTHSRTRLHTRSLTHPPTHSPTHSLTHSLIPPTHPPTHVFVD